MKHISPISPKSIQKTLNSLMSGIKPQGLTVDNIVEHVESLTPCQLECINYLLKVNNVCPVIFPSIPRIAQKADCCKMTVMRGNKRLEDLGLIQITRSKVSSVKNNPNVYRLHRLFRNPRVRWLLGKILSAVRGLSLAFLFSAPAVSLSNPYFLRNVTPLSNTCFIYIKNSLKCPVSVDYVEESNAPPDSEARNDQKKERLVMLRRESESPLTKAKQEIVQFLNPTPRARIEVEKYSLEVLAYGTKQIRRQLSEGAHTKQPFLMLFKYCESYSRQNSIAIDRENVDRLKEVYQPSGPWSSIALDIAQIKKEHNSQKKRNWQKSEKRSYVQSSYNKNKNQEKAVYVPYSTKHLKASNLSSPEQRQVSVESREEIMAAIAKLKNSDGKYNGIFAEISGKGLEARLALLG